MCVELPAQEELAKQKEQDEQEEQEDQKEREEREKAEKAEEERRKKEEEAAAKAKAEARPPKMYRDAEIQTVFSGEDAIQQVDTRQQPEVLSMSRQTYIKCLWTSVAPVFVPFKGVVETAAELSLCYARISWRSLPDLLPREINLAGKSSEPDQFGHLILRFLPWEREVLHVHVALMSMRCSQLRCVVNKTACCIEPSASIASLSPSMHAHAATASSGRSHAQQ